MDIEKKTKSLEYLFKEKAAIEKELHDIKRKNIKLTSDLMYRKNDLKLSQKKEIDLSEELKASEASIFSMVHQMLAGSDFNLND